MNIDYLITSVRPYIPFTSEQTAQQFINQLNADDRMALISAMYIGRSHINSTKLDDDYFTHLNSGAMNRYWNVDTVQDNEIARILYEKNINLTAYYDAFIRCTTNSGYDRSKF